MLYSASSYYDVSGDDNGDAGEYLYGDHIVDDRGGGWICSKDPN